MPDHEEAVREARAELDHIIEEYGWEKHGSYGYTTDMLMGALATYADAIRARERAKYTALVDAATNLREKWEEPLVDGVTHVVWYARHHQFVDLDRLTGELVRVLARFQSEEGFNA